MGGVESCELDCGKRQRAKMLQEKSASCKEWDDFEKVRSQLAQPRLRAFRPSGRLENTTGSAILPLNPNGASPAAVHRPAVFSDIEPDMLPPRPARVSSRQESAATFSFSSLEVLDQCCSSRHEDPYPDSRKQKLDPDAWVCLFDLHAS